MRGISMRLATLVLLAILLLSFAGDALAQTSGMFGPRVVGSTIRPGVSQFDDGLQRAPSGAFLGTGRPAGQNMFVTPWRQPSEAPVYLPFAYGMLPNGQLAAIPPNLIVPATGAVGPALTPPDSAVAPDMIGQPGAPSMMGQPEALPSEGPAGYAPPGEPASMPSPAAAPTSSGGLGPNNVPSPVAPSNPGATVIPRGGVRVAVDYSALLGLSRESEGQLPGSLYPAGARFDDGYLPGLSERLTQTARDHGMQVSAPIRVSMLNGTAIVYGTVGTSHDRLLIANMVLLEPGINQLSNRLSVAPGEVPAAK